MVFVGLSNNVRDFHIVYQRIRIAPKIPFTKFNPYNLGMRESKKCTKLRIF